MKSAKILLEEFSSDVAYSKADITAILAEHNKEINEMIDEMINNDDYKGKYKYYSNGWNKALTELKQIIQDAL